jgi:hypothetical protein
MRLEQSIDRSLKSKMLILSDQVARLACTQSGSRYLQEELKKADPSFLEFILTDIGSGLPSIMIDRYGNYFC